MASYAKLFSSITESSLWCVGSKEARLLFVSMLARADAAGVVESSLPGLAKLASLTLDETVNAVNELESPDPHDRSGVAEGRRITKIDGGWMLVNYSVYRERRSEAERREYMRTYMQEYRKRGVNNDVNSVSKSKPMLAQAEAEAEEKKTTFAQTSEQPKSSPPSISIDFEELVWKGITEKDLSTWKAAYPAVDVDTDLKRALDWCRSNRRRGKKSNYRRFLSAWLSRSQDRGGGLKGERKHEPVAGEPGFYEAVLDRLLPNPE